MDPAKFVRTSSNVRGPGCMSHQWLGPAAVACALMLICAHDTAAGTTRTRGVLAGDSDQEGDVDVFSFNDGQANRQLVQSGYLAHANVVTSAKVNDTETGITELRLTATVFGENDNRYFLSNDGGATWRRVESGEDFTFPSPGDDARWRAELVGADRVLPPSLLAIEITGPGFTPVGNGAGQAVVQGVAVVVAACRRGFCVGSGVAMCRRRVRRKERRQDS